MKADRRTERLVALAVAAALLFNFPLLAIFNRPAWLAGVPLGIAYLFIVWALVIVAVAWVMERGQGKGGGPGRGGGDGGA